MEANAPVAAKPYQNEMHFLACVFIAMQLAYNSAAYGTVPWPSKPSRAVGKHGSEVQFTEGFARIAQQPGLEIAGPADTSVCGRFSS